MELNHFLITRFNIRVHGWETAKDGSIVLDEQWLKHRFSLFETYCLPSVKNQTNKNFNWLIFFDAETPLVYKNRIETLLTNYNNFHVIYIKDSSEIIAAINQFIKNNIDIDKPNSYVITSRMDNDDLIHKNYIQKIQTLAKPCNQMIIDLRKGFQINKKDDSYDVRIFYNVYNAFISLVEKSSNFTNIMSKMHRDWAKMDNIVYNNTTPLWIELVHEKNKLNSVKNLFYQTTRINFKDFGLTTQLKINTPFQVLKSNIQIFVKRLWLSIKKNIKKINNQ